MLIRRYIRVFFLIIFLFSCARESELQRLQAVINVDKNSDLREIYELLNEDPTRLSYNVMLWTKMIEDGKIQQDIVQHATRTYYFAVRNGYDSLATFSAACLSQVYTLEYNRDSVITYLCRIDEQYLKDDIVLSSIVHNVAANNAIRSHLDYNTALTEYFKALELMTDPRFTANQIALLSNIAMIYYVKNDSTGLCYAEQAFQLSQQLDSPFWKVNSSLVKAQLLYTSERYEESVAVLDYATSLTPGQDLPMFTPIIDMLYADNYARQMKIQEAYRFYARAHENIHLTNPGYALKVKIHYAEFLFEQQKLEEALNMYKSALELSYRSKNLSERQRILVGISNTYLRMGLQKMAVKYYVSAQSYLDTLESNRKEYEFQEIRSAYDMEKSLADRKIKAFSVQNHQLTNGIVLFLVSVFVLLAIVFFSLYRRRMRKTVQVSLPVEQCRKIDEMLCKDELYRNSELTLNSFAARLEMDPHQLQECLKNSYAMTFKEYVNRIRVGKATEILSDAESSIPLKNLSRYLGFSSTAIFYREFQKYESCTPAEYRSRNSRVS